MQLQKVKCIHFHSVVIICCHIKSYHFIAGLSTRYKSKMTIKEISLQQPVPLVHVSSQHAISTYEFEKLGTISDILSMHLVGNVDEVGLYQCKIKSGEECVSSRVMALEVTPSENNLYRRSPRKSVKEC